MDFGYGDQRRCYLRPRQLRDLYQNPIVLDALMEQLNVPGKAVTLKRLSEREKQAAIEGQIEHYRKSDTSIWKGVPAAEILAASVWRAYRLPRRSKNEVFSAVRRESDLLRPVAQWLASKGHKPHKEVALGRIRIDVLGYRRGGFLSSERFTAVELKNDDAQFARALHQLGTVGEYVNAVYLACTPAFAADHLDRNAESAGVRHWDSGVLERELSRFGVGLLLVERDEVVEMLRPAERDPAAARFMVAKQGCTEKLLINC